MDQLLPYEAVLNQQWIDLPLPDENMAWADMRRRLDEEEKRRIIPWWRGCAGWGLLGILLLGLGWWIVRPEKWFTNKQSTEQTTPVAEKKNIPIDTGINQADTGTTLARSSSDSVSQINNSDSGDVKIETILPKKINSTETNDQTIITSKQGVTGKKKKQPTKNNPAAPIEKNKPIEDNTIVPVDPVRQHDQPVDSANTNAGVDQSKKDPVTNILTTNPVVDTVQSTTKDSATKKPQSDQAAQEKKSKKDSTKRTPMVYSAGIGLHQQLPVDGQQWSPYSSSGRKTSMADYIPSVYLRVTKPGKWFLQSEFRYGAPQHTKEFAFRQTVTTDTNAQGVRFVNTNTFRLRKTFYHQLPLSFNYYILPNWSLGAGMQWNNFHSAIAESEIIRRNTSAQIDSSLGKIINALKKDSAYEFRRSYWQAIVQTQYQWKRFTIGARYNFGLQPYINFTLPGGTPQEEKNSSLQVFILFELLKSKKK